MDEKLTEAFGLRLITDSERLLDFEPKLFFNGILNLELAC